MENSKLNLIGHFKSNLQNDRDFTFFIFVAIFSGVGSGIYNTVFSNYLNDVFHLSETQRGFLEFPREMPGVLIIFVLALLAFMGDIHIAAIGMIGAAIGAFGLGINNGNYYMMLAGLIIYGLGTHMCMPLTPSIGMNLSKREKYGDRLGLFSAWGLGATLLGYAVVWGGFYFKHMDYRIAFVLSGIFYVFASAFYMFMKNRKPEKRKFHLIFRKKFTLFYLLSVANGARKQIFLTFAPWVLITTFHLGPAQFAVLGVLVSIVSILTRTLVGKAIDTYGERFVLSTEAVCLFIICFGYIFSGQVFQPGVAVIVMCACYVIDGSMTVVEMARSTYVKKISTDPSEVTPTLSTGLSMDHVVSMTVPFFGGLLWSTTGAYQSVFVAAAVIALINFSLSTRIRIKSV
ncbi:MAG: MFS transporter [Oscillospiraceae bacterium]|nr:MFS transporter [Oscillospiraceae bacterium]